MTCPFAKFATLLPAAPSASDVKAYHSYHHHHSSATKTASIKVTMTLSEALKVGTAQSHRAVEKSKGVSMLLHSLSSSSPSSAGEQEALHFDRLDYVKFNIVLTYIYIALEAAMHHASSDPLLVPLFQDKDLVPLLARTSALLRDIDAHLATIHLHTGATLADLSQDAGETYAVASTSVTGDEDVEDPTARSRLLQLVQQALSPALELASAPAKLGAITADHVALLSPAQIRSTLTYVDALLTLSTTASRRGLLIAHAYTRYLGDLSGGQHIVRRTSKRFPIDPSLSDTPGAGFEFYNFAADAAALKARFRTAMEAGLTLFVDSRSHVQVVKAVVQEANKAFDLNTQVFEALLPANLRMQPQPEMQEKEGKLKVERGEREIIVLVALLLAAAVMCGGGMAWSLPLRA